MLGHFSLHLQLVQGQNIAMDKHLKPAVMRIRPARVSDAAGIAGVLNPIIRAGCYTIMREPVSLAGQVAFMRDFPARGVFLVAEDSRILGIQDVVPVTDGVRSHVGEISTFVALDALRQGIGRRLTEVMVKHTLERGYTKLIARIRGDNDKALAFYQNQGFRLIGSRKQVRLGGGFIDQVLAERLIAG